MRISILFFLLTLLSSCKKTTEISVASNEDADSLKHHSLSEKLPDQAGITGTAEADAEVYMDGDDMKSQFELDEGELQQITDIYNKLKEDHPDSTVAPRELYTDLVHQWLPLQFKNGKFYLDRYCELQKRWILTDSTLIRFFQDGPAPALILEVTKKGNEYQIKATLGALYFKLIDTKREIYSFTDNGYADSIYVIPRENVKNFPIIYHECEGYEE